MSLSKPCLENRHLGPINDNKALKGFIDFVIKCIRNDVRRVLLDNVSKQPLKRINIIQGITENIILSIFA